MVELVPVLSTRCFPGLLTEWRERVLSRVLFIIQYRQELSSRVSC